MTTVQSREQRKLFQAAPEPSRTIEREDATATIYQGDCRELLPAIPQCANAQVDLIFADPPFNWNRGYDEWDDKLHEDEYLEFTYDWLDRCCDALKPNGTLWVNIPDTWAAEIVIHLKRGRKANGLQPMHMVNWCIWHYRFGQNTKSRFISSKVHALYFCKDPDSRTWNRDDILEISDRRSIYFDKRTENKRDGVAAGMRLPMDVWYGKYWGRIQGNNSERRANHDNQLPETYLERVILACSNPGDLVLDPFLGSGTTGTVALDWQRNFIGIEYSKAMAKSAAERIDEGMVRKGESQGQSSAIFGSRRKAPRAAAAAQD